MVKVLITEKIHEYGINLLERQGLEVVCNFDMTAKELEKAIADVDAIIIRGRTKVTRELLSHGKKLKVIGMHGVGLDHINLEEQGIAVLNVPDGNVDSTAELTLALMLAVARKIVAANNDVKSGGWNTNNFVGVQLKGKTLGIIALGKIGSSVANVCTALGMEVLAYDPHCAREYVNPDVTLTSLDNLLAKADVISIHAPLKPETRYLIADEQIAKMKDGVILLNAARGGILAEEAAIRGLKSGKIAGIGLDVVENEPPDKEYCLRQFDNVVLTPHIGARTKEAQIYVAKSISQKVADFLANSI